MEVALSSSDTMRRRTQELADELTSYAGGEYQVQQVDLESGINSATWADSVVLVHCDPAQQLRTFLEQMQNTAKRVPTIVVEVPKCGETITTYLMDGASGCLTVEHGVVELVDAIETVQMKQPYLPPAVQATLLEEFVTVRQEFDASFGFRRSWGLESLTDRERDVLELIGKGLTNREIADRLFVEVGTVKNHVHRILTKLEVSDRRDAADYYRYSRSFSSAEEPA